MADGTGEAPALLREDAGGVATLTLNRPAQLNALSEALLAALQAEFDALAVDAATKVVVIRSAGRAFCAGHDLREMERARAAPDRGRAYFTSLFAQCARMMTSITRLPQPVIAEVHALATAAGCQLVASCDMAVASREAKFGVNGVNIGLFCSTPMVALTRNIPAKHAFEMLTTGGFIDAERAERLGLVNRVAAPEDLAQETRALAETVAGKLASAVRIGKRAFYEQAEMSLDAAYAHTGRVMAENMLHRDTAEGVAAFLEKRRPDWS
ncbi:MAG: enoyl-CoA hydratase [Rubrimonas sp.]|uniref:enoyl-CoA hydratase n=1 Tax=Rubrimonas sp. TaxID=2036015 RepID=UPI002FDD947B